MQTERNHRHHDDAEKQPWVQHSMPLMADHKSLARMLGIGVSCLYAMDRSGQLGPMGLYLRRRRLWPVEEIQAWVRAQCPRREVWVARTERQDGNV
jgi:hypothetical protein